MVGDAKKRLLVGTVLRKKLLTRLQIIEEIGEDRPILFKAERYNRASLKDIESDLSSEDELDFSDLVDPLLVQVDPDVTLTQVHHIFLQLGLRYVKKCARLHLQTRVLHSSFLLFTKTGVLKGILTKKAFLSRLEKLRSKEL